MIARGALLDDTPPAAPPGAQALAACRTNRAPRVPSSPTPASTARPLSRGACNRAPPNHAHRHRRAGRRRPATDPRDTITRTRAFARGEPDVAEGVRRRFVGGAAAREVATPSAAAAAKAAGQAAAIPHMGAHALGAAAYAAKAAGLAAPDRPEAVPRRDPMAAQPHVGGDQNCTPAASACR
ncbi:MAG: putative immunity protein [Solirubrobacteraceae bacterium]